MPTQLPNTIVLQAARLAVKLDASSSTPRLNALIERLVAFWEGAVEEERMEAQFDGC